VVRCLSKSTDLIRKQDNESWQKIAVNLDKKIKYVILNFNRSVY